jgi:hypothetical protein
MNAKVFNSGVNVGEVVGQTVCSVSAGWFELRTDPMTNSPVLLVHCPPTQPTGIDYLKRSVELAYEFLAAQQPFSCPLVGLRQFRLLASRFHLLSAARRSSSEVNH